MKFVADAMLGRLAKWLRLLGYDTVYIRDAEDSHLARIALKEDRMLLTKDNELAGRKMLRGRTLLIESADTGKQLGQVVDHFNLQTTGDKMFTLCVVCNVPIDEVSKESIEDLVPPYVYQTQNAFRQCHNCGRVYWKGTHVDHVLDSLKHDMKLAHN